MQAICAKCKRLFAARRRTRKFCSGACKQAFHYAIKMHERTRIGQCAQCGKEFETRSARRKYCSGRCNQTAYRERPENRAKANLVSVKWREAHPDADKDRWAADTERMRAQCRARYQANKERIRVRTLAARYGLTVEALGRMRQAQKGRCACCGRKDRLLIDHCHKTGKVRALLCNGCNSAAGHLRDSPRRAQALARYLIEQRERTTQLQLFRSA